MLQLSRWKIGLVILSVVLGVLFALPNLLTAEQRAALPGFMPKKTLNLGIDLQGGAYLLMEDDIPALTRKEMTNTVEDIRNVLKTERIAGTPSQVNGTIYVRISD